MAETFKYKAFISYSHADRAFARRLQGWLESYVLPSKMRLAKGPNAPRHPLYPVFRDEDELVPGQDLPARIQNALKQSEFLIVVCSSRGAKSKWVEKEIIDFSKLGRSANFLAVVIDGMPYASEDTSTEALPQALRFRVAENGTITDEEAKALWIDYRKGAPGRRRAFLRIVAALLDLTSLDELIHRDQEARRARLFRNAAIGALFLAIAGIAVSVLRARLSQRKSDVLSELARQSYDNGFYDRAVRYTTVALANAIDAKNKAETDLWKDAYASRATAVIHPGAGSVFSAFFSRDGTRILTASFDGTAQVWDAANLRLIISLPRQPEAIMKAEFSPDNTRIVTASPDHFARVWDTRTGTELFSLHHKNQVWDAAFSSDGKKIVTACGDKYAHVWDAGSGHLLKELPHDEIVWSAAFSPDGSRIVTSSQNGVARVWRLADTRNVLTLGDHGSVMHYAEFSPDGDRIVTASFDKTARIWSAVDGHKISEFGHEGPVWTARFSPDGARLVTASEDGTVRLWDAASRQLLGIFRGHEAQVWSAAFSPDKNRIISASADGTARIWNAAPSNTVLKQIPQKQGRQNGVRSVDFSPDGKRIVAALEDNTAHVIDAVNGRDILILRHNNVVLNAQCGPDESPDSSDQNHAVYSAQFSQDGKWIVTASSDHSARIWNAESGTLMSVLPHCGEVRNAAFSRDGKRVVTASLDDTARVWDASNGQLLRTFHHDQDDWVWVWNAAFSPDGRRVIAVYSKPGKAEIWDVETKRSILSWTAHEAGLWSASFSPDGTRVLTSANDRKVRIWNAATGELILDLGGPNGHTNEVWSAHFSPDGSRIVSTSKDGTSRVWDAADGSLLATLDHGNTGVWNAAFSPDDSKVVTATVDGFMRVWPLGPGLQGPPSARISQVCATKLAGGLQYFSDSELRLAPVLNPALDKDACNPATVWTRLLVTLRLDRSGKSESSSQSKK